jgi:predicted MFS family arabinose efflux permease
MARRIRRDAAILVPVIGAQLIASTGIFLVPFIVGALLAASNQFDERSVGFLISMEALAASLTTVGLSAWTRPHSRRRVTLIGAGLAIAGNALALVSASLPLLVVARLSAGIGAGVVTAESAAVVARGRDRERLISGLTAAAVLNGSIWIFAIPYVPDALGYRGPYLAMIFAALIGAMLLTRLPSPPMRRAAAPTQQVASDGGRLGLAVLPAIFLTQLGQGSFWTFVEIYGHNAGLSGEAIGGFLSLATLLLLVGVVGTAAAGTRLGRFGPLFALTAVNLVSIVAITYAKDPTVYVVANVVQAVTNLSSLVYQLGLAAAVDRSGRLFAAANGLVGLGNGLGSAVAGAIALPFGAHNVGLAVVLFDVTALVLFALIGTGVARRWVSLRA